MHIIKSWFWPGVITTALLTALAGWFLAGPVDQHLTDTVNAALESQHSWASAQIDGRDLVLKGIAPSQEALAEALKISSETFGVRAVENAATLFAPGGAIFLCRHQIR